MVRGHAAPRGGLSQGFPVRRGAGARAGAVAVGRAKRRGFCWRGSWRGKANLLVLDEPTNDLDVETLDLLQELLGDYDGTVLLVSHDRDFLDRVAT
jgi:ABC-type transport system involved in cytochrome bd biosynthesis fused ATPase/permease subunit